MSARGRLARSVIAVTAVVSLLSVGTPASAGHDLAEVRAATARYHRVEMAQADGWVLRPDLELDHCFDNPGTGAMGYHYLNTGLFDTVTDPRQPEALVYAPGPNGKHQLAAVEWIVPADAWTETGNPGPPTVLGHDMHLNTTLGVWVLHAWVFKNNPAGMFEDWNPQVTCD